jgi:hypothetical protein
LGIEKIINIISTKEDVMSVFVLLNETQEIVEVDLEKANFLVRHDLGQLLTSPGEKLPKKINK